MVSGRKPQSSDSAGSCCLRRVGVGSTAAVSGFLPLTARGCGLPLAVARPSQGLYGMNSGVLCRCAAIWRGLSVMLAEGVEFEPTDHLGVSGFQDRRIRPLCHPSALTLWYQPAPAVSADYVMRIRRASGYVLAAAGWPMARFQAASSSRALASSSGETLRFRYPLCCRTYQPP